MVLLQRAAIKMGKLLEVVSPYNKDIVLFVSLFEFGFTDSDGEFG